MSSSEDLKRMQVEYQRRADRPDAGEKYSLFNPVNLFAVQSRQRKALEMLRRARLFPLDGRQMLEIGCGAGGVLREFLLYCRDVRQLHGLDLIGDRLVDCRQALTGAAILLADGQHIPYRSASFDLALQFTAFSSVLDPAVKSRMAQEMLRVLKPGGAILWYDFWLNPTNPQTRGIRPPEIRALFAGCRFNFRRITLAPPIARRVVPLSWTFATLLEGLRIFNSHYLVLIQPQ